jgi:hypothetical protein
VSKLGSEALLGCGDGELTDKTCSMMLVGFRAVDGRLVLLLVPVE